MSQATIVIAYIINEPETKDIETIFIELELERACQS
jgi:hypothetical protein